MFVPAVLAAIALLAAGFGSHARDRTPVRPAVHAASTVAHPRAASAASTRADRLLSIAQQRYREEASGAAVHAQLRRIAHDPALLRALRAGNTTALRAVALSDQLTRHAHVCRVRVIRGSTLLADAGGRFVVAASHTTLRTAKGRTARLEVSIQDMIGYVRYMHRNFPVQVLVRGSAAGHVETSLPAAKTMALPDRGPVTIAGTRYLARSFHQKAVAGEPVKVWILVRA